MASKKMKPGKTTGHWTGPHRVLLQEGSTLWLAHGAALVRAKMNQVRCITRREELEAVAKGAAVYRQPVTVETLLRNFTGKHYTNVTGEAPSARQMIEDVTGADVQIEARPAKVPRRDRPQGSKRKEAEQRSDDVEVEDESQQADAAQAPVPVDMKHEDVPGEAIPDLGEALKRRGPNAVDGLPDQEQPAGNGCPVPQCTLPGGHGGPHKDEHGGNFTWTPYGGRISLEEDSYAGDSSSSEELVTTPRSRDQKEVKPPEKEEVMYVFEFGITEEDVKFLAAKPHKSTQWLSKKMAEKSKEHQWSQLSLEQKKDFDLSQARELSNVLQPRALRSLTAQELKSFNPAKCMQMRCVLTTKSDGSAKSRLVVLGYQAHNLTQVQSTAPTMSRISRNALLVQCANRKFKLRCGDVTAAFLQADENIEDQELYVWAPAELAVVYGADPKHPVLPLKIRKAFYGLVQSPRLWYQHVVKTLLAQGWQQLASDRCIFILVSEGSKHLEEPEVIAIAGVHVDDFLIGGDESNKEYLTAKERLESSFKWGKWEEGQFTFAGCEISQAEDFTIKVHQNTYTEKYVEEIPIAKDRAACTEAAATATEISQLRGLIGSLAWRTSQTSPQYQADVGLLLSEIPYATVSTILQANKLVREVRRAPQHLLFPSWGVHWKDMAIVVWADASNSNRPDKGPTMGLIGGCAPKSILQGHEQQLALMCWKSSKTPRQVLGSNGAEVQAITEGEDMVFKLRGLWAEINGVKIERGKIHEMVRDKTCGALVMDSRGIFDSMTKNISSLHGLRSARSGYELTIAVNQAVLLNTQLRWVNGDVQLADSLTKSNARRVLLQFLANGQRWKLVYDEKFTSGKKVRKQELEKRMAEDQEAFVMHVKKMASDCRYPWTDVELRNKGDAISTLDPYIIKSFTEESELNI